MDGRPLTHSMGQPSHPNCGIPVPPLPPSPLPVKGHLQGGTERQGGVGLNFTGTQAKRVNSKAGLGNSHTQASQLTRGK